LTNFRKWKSQNEGYLGTRRSSIEEHKTSREEDGAVTSILTSREVKVGSWVKSIAAASECRIEGKSLDMLQVNCRNVYDKE
jgi:hypothetical protein